jgi:hypothetical protein
MVELQNVFVGQNVLLRIINSLGKEISSEVAKMTTAEWKREIDFSEVAKGVYFIEIKTKTDLMKKKLIITK